MAQYILFNVNGKVGCKDSKGNIVIEPQYDCVVIEEETALLCKDGLWGAKGISQNEDLGLSLLSRIIDIPIVYLEIKKLKNSLLFYYGVKKREKVDNQTIDRYTIVNFAGNEIDVMQREFNDIIFDSNFTYYTQDRVLTSRGGKYGFISLKGYISIPFIYDAIEERPDGRFNVRIDNKWGIIDLEGRQVVAIKYDASIPLKNDNTIVKDVSSGKFGVLSSIGFEKIPCLYDAIVVTIPEVDDRYDRYADYWEIEERYEGHVKYVEVEENESYIYVGYGNDYSYSENTLLDSGIECSKWGCCDNTGKLIIPPYYLNIIIRGRHILATNDNLLRCPGAEYIAYNSRVLYDKQGNLILKGGKNDEKCTSGNYYVDYEEKGEYIVAKTVKSYFDKSKFTQSFDLYNKDAEFIIGGFNDIDIEEGVILLHFGGYWETIHHRKTQDSLGNYFEDAIEWEEENWKEANGRWLVIDDNLKSIIRRKEGSDYYFEKGSICTITPKEKNGKTINYWSFPLELFSLSKPVVSHGIVVVKCDSKKVAIRIEDGVCSQQYEDIKAIDTNTFFISETDHNNHIKKIGICSFSKTIVGIEEGFVFLTTPVRGIVFGIKSDKNIYGNAPISLACFNTNDVHQQYIAIENIGFRQLVGAIERGELELITCSEGGCVHFSVRNIQLFDESFIDKFPYKIIQKESAFHYRMYWYSGIEDLKYTIEEKEEHRRIIEELKLEEERAAYREEL
jgi:hypothetical protein